MNKKVEAAINDQINAEIFSAYLYLSMAAYFDAKSLDGFASWMKNQAKEEMIHAMKFYDYVYERGGKVEMAAIAKPQTQFDSPLNAFEETLKHEQAVTKMINSLYELASSEKDYASQSMLKWFIDEQVEEEDTASSILEKLKLAGEEGPGLFMIDKELGQRTAPAQTSESSKE